MVQVVWREFKLTVAGNETRSICSACFTERLVEEDNLDKRWEGRRRDGGNSLLKQKIFFGEGQKPFPNTPRRPPGWLL